MPGERTLDPKEYRQAQELDAQHLYWWILWAPYRRKYVAFFLGPADVEPVEAGEVDELRPELVRIEHEEFAPPAARVRSAPQAPLRG